VVGNASGELDLLHAAPTPLRVVLLLPPRLLQDPIFIELAETLLALLCGGVRRETAYSGVLGRLKARIGVSPKCIVESVKLLPVQLPLVLERVRVVAKLVE